MDYVGALTAVTFSFMAQLSTTNVTSIQETAFIPGNWVSMRVVYYLESLDSQHASVKCRCEHQPYGNFHACRQQASVQHSAAVSHKVVHHKYSVVVTNKVVMSKTELCAGAPN